jgi:hypothetical protein
MNSCDQCDLKGYSRELCLMHIRHCRKHPGAGAASPATRVSARTAGGVAVGVSAGLILATAASFVGGPALFYALMLKLVAGGGLVGGGWGLAKGLAAERDDRRPAPPPSRARRGLSRRPTRRSP